ncbi:putative membrane protein [Methanohalophilus levihalophilus]|nr:putative membrane protein [Methanohalophilus levihalophilus]
MDKKKNNGLILMAGALVTIMFYCSYWLYEYLKINPSIDEYVASPELNFFVIVIGTLIIWIPLIYYLTPKE